MNAGADRPSASTEKPERGLPSAWAWVRLGDICSFEYGAGLRADARQGGDVAVYGSNGIVGWHNQALTKGPTIVVGRKGSIGEVHYSVEPCWPIDTTYFISTTHIPTDFQWLSMALKALDLGSLNKAAAIPGLSRDDAYAQMIRLPPFDEQGRIASRLQEHLAEVEIARAAAQAQLDAACVLPVAWLYAVFDGPEAQRWPRRAFGEICQITARQVDPTLTEIGKLPHVSGENIESGTCRLTNVRSAAEDGMISGKYLFGSGDILYSKLRPYLRKVAVANFEGVCSADMYPLHVNPDLLDAQFTAWMLLSDEFTRYAVGLSDRARMPKLNREQLFRWEAFLPGLREQRSISARLVEQMDEQSILVDALKSKLDAIDDLPSTLLADAFRNEI